MTEKFDYLYVAAERNTFLHGEFFKAKLKNNSIVKIYNEETDTWIGPLLFTRKCKVF